MVPIFLNIKKTIRNLLLLNSSKKVFKQINERYCNSKLTNDKFKYSK